MTETSINYAKALYGLSVPEEAICETEKIFENTPEIGKMLENPLVSLKEKEQKGILKAELLYVTCPTEAQEDKMKEFLRNQFSASEVELTLTEDKNLVGGFVLRAGDREYDWSLIGRYKKLKQKLTRR